MKENNHRTKLANDIARCASGNRCRDGDTCARHVFLKTGDKRTPYFMPMPPALGRVCIYYIPIDREPSPKS